MPMLSKILLPVDFSERSLPSVRYAGSLAGHFDAELTLLHVLTPPQYEFGAIEIGGSMLAELYKGRNQQVSADLDHLITSELRGVKTRPVVVEGEPARKIVEFSEQEHSDVILMPTHGYGPFRRFILGSNTAKVLHDADCPVWTGVHLESPPELAGASIRNILCGVDLGPQSSKTVCWAAMLAQEFGASLTLIHATAAEPDLGDDTEVNWRIDVREAAEQELLRLQQFVNVNAEALIESGEAPAVICSAVARLNAELLVIGRGSAAGVFGRLRTNAYSIIRQSPCPVVSV
jgi:nucleotide-binding universal stress UspA family protein